MQRIIDAYIEYLAANPYIVSENFKETVVTFFLWMILWKVRKIMIDGLIAQGINKAFEGSEQVVYIALWMLVPLFTHLLYYTGTIGMALYAMGLECFLVGFAIAGAKIFDYAMALISRVPGFGSITRSETVKQEIVKAETVTETPKP